MHNARTRFAQLPQRIIVSFSQENERQELRLPKGRNHPQILRRRQIALILTAGVATFAAVYNISVEAAQQLISWIKSQEDERNWRQDTKLTDGEIKKLKEQKIDPEELKGGRRTGQSDLYKDRDGNIYVKPKDGRGPGEPTGVNIKRPNPGQAPPGGKPCS